MTSVTWLGSARRAGTLGETFPTECRTTPCPQGQSRLFDWTCPKGQFRCWPITETCPDGYALPLKGGTGDCVPITCPSGRDVNTLQCTTAPGASPCNPGYEPHWDPQRRTVICVAKKLVGGIYVDSCPAGTALGASGCVPLECPAGTLRDTDTGECLPDCGPGFVRDPFTRECRPLGECLPGYERNLATLKCEPVAAAPTAIPGPAPGECLSAQQVVAAQPCFYFDAQGRYVGPAELVQGVDLAELYKFCLQTFAAGYFYLPLCDAPATIPAPPSCLSPEERGVVNYCREKSWTGDNRTANYFCWAALKAPAELGDWEKTSDCQPSAPPVEPAADVPPEAGPLPGTAPGTVTPGTVPVAQAKKSSAAPLLIGAAVVAAAAYYFLS